MTTTPVSVLKPALRVIHCLQKERGTSCATSAALGGASWQEKTVHARSEVETMLSSDSTSTSTNFHVTSFAIETQGSKQGGVIRVLSQQLKQTRLETDLALIKLRNFVSAESSRSASYSSSTQKALKRLRGSEKSIERALLKVRTLIPLEDYVTDNNLHAGGSSLIRSAVAEEPTPPPKHLVSFHRVYVAYNALVGYVINDIIKHQMIEFETLQQGIEQIKGAANVIGSPMRRSESSCNMSVGKSSSTLENPNETMAQEENKGPRERCNTGGRLSSPKMKPKSRGHRRGASLGMPLMADLGSGLDRIETRASSSSDLGHKKVNPALFPVRKAAALYKLLYSFVQLKESTGTERAYLFAMLAMPTPSDTVKGSSSYGSLTSEASFGSRGGEHELEHDRKKREALSENHELLFNNLVMEIENSRSILKDVQHQAKQVVQLEKGQNGMSTGSVDDRFTRRTSSKTKITGAWLLDLVQEVLQPSKAFVEVQNLIRRDFDLLSFRKAVTMEHFWGLLTVYIEKLHSLELLIIEELESSYEHTVMDETLKNNSGLMAGPMIHAPLLEPIPSNDVDSKAKLDVREFLVKLARSSTLGTVGEQEDEASVLKMVSGLPAEDIKEAMLSLIQRKEPLVEKRGSFSLVHDISGVDEALKSIDIFDDPAVKAPAKVQNEWEIGLYEVKFLRRIGKGAAGTTYFGKWRGEPVALKVASTSALGVEGWSAEIETLTHLHHPNVIRMLGCIHNEAPLTRCLVLEYCDGGDLESALLKPAPHNLFFRAAHGLSNGMAYLHNRKIIHRDIKPSNVLIHGDYTHGSFVVKLTDFGVATKMKDECSRSNYTAETGTYRWMAPEVIRHEEYSNKADVYSFALLLWQLLSREEPFAPQSQLAAAGMVAIEQARPPIPEDTPAGIKTLIQACWSDSQDKRPDSEEITSLVLKVEKSLTEDDKIWLSMPMGHQVYLFSEEDDSSEIKKKANHAAQHSRQTSSASDMSIVTDSSGPIHSPLRRRFSSKMGFGPGNKPTGKHQHKKFSLFKKKAPNDSVKLFLKDRRSSPFL